MGATTALRWLQRGRRARWHLVNPSFASNSRAWEPSEDIGTASLESLGTAKSSSLADLRRSLVNSAFSGSLTSARVKGNSAVLCRTCCCTISTEADRYQHQESPDKNETNSYTSEPISENLVVVQFSGSSDHDSSVSFQDKREGLEATGVNDAASRWTRGQWKIEAWEAWNFPPCDITLHGRASLSPGAEKIGALKRQSEARLNCCTLMLMCTRCHKWESWIFLCGLDFSSKWHSLFAMTAACRQRLHLHIPSPQTPRVVSILRLTDAEHAVRVL